MAADRGSKALATVQVTLPNRRDPQSVRAALSDRLLLSEAIGIVSQMLRGYANGGQQASDSYIGALAEVLCTYPRCVAARAGDLVHGVPRETKFLPTPADVIAWCERESAELRGVVARDDHFRNIQAGMIERERQEKQIAADREKRPTYDELKARHGENWGIGQREAVEDKAAREVSAQRMREANETMLLREYAGAAPHEAAPGIAVSRELVERIEQRCGRRAAQQVAAE